MRKKSLFAILLSLALILTASAFAADPVKVESITLGDETVLVAVGKTVSVKAEILPKKAAVKKLEWASSDESVATVTGGKVKGVAPGTATITARATDDSGVMASVEVRVVTPVKKVKLSEKTLPLAPDVSWRILATVEPNDATIREVEWTTSNPKVATVDENGAITGVAKGTATVTATARDGSKMKASVSVKVNEYDMVFRTKSGQSAEYFYGSGFHHIRGSVKTGNVKIPKLDTTVLALIGKDVERQNVTVSPVKPGEDVVTIKTGSKSFRYTVFVSPEAFPETGLVPAEETGGETAEILFLDIPWGTSLPDAKALLSAKSISIKTPTKSGSTMRAQLSRKMKIADLEATHVYLSFAFDEGNESYETDNRFTEGAYYFDKETPFDDAVNAARAYFSLPQGEIKDQVCIWKAGGTTITLSKNERFVLLAFTPAEE